MPWVSLFTAPLLAANRAVPGRPRSLCVEHTSMIVACLRSTLRCGAAQPTQNLLSTYKLMSRRHTATGNSVKGERCCVPVLLTSMPMGSDVGLAAIHAGVDGVAIGHVEVDRLDPQDLGVQGCARGRWPQLVPYNQPPQGAGRTERASRDTAVAFAAAGQESRTPGQVE